MNRWDPITVRVLGGLSFAFVAACGGGGGSSAETQTNALPPAPTPVFPFRDVTQPSNIAFRVGITNFPLSRVAESTFGGAASGDCDADGDIDLFITYGDSGGTGGGPNRLYLNQLTETGNGLLFRDVADAAGVAYTRPDGIDNDRHSGPAFADMDGDGDLDLFLGGIYGDPNYIYENLGDCQFTDVTSNSPGIANMLAAHTISAAFGDYDLDGDLDLFLTHFGTADSTYDPPNPAQSEHLWRNDSDTDGIRFVNVSAASGISSILRATRSYPESTQIEDYTFAPTFARIDGDAWPDLVVAADFGTTQAMLNNGDGTFRNVTNEDVMRVQWGMGSALGDVDNDGDLDWFVTSILGPSDGHVVPRGNRLYRNDFGSGVANAFTDITEDAGVADGEWGWGACFLDIDNDADLDIFHTNGWDFDSAQVHGRDYSADPSRLFEAVGGGRFVERAASFGLDDTYDSRGVVCADFDEDGDTDLLLLTDDAPNSAKLLENRSAAAGNNFLRVRLVGLAPNTEAAGARIFVTLGTRTQMREVFVGSGFIAQSPAVQAFGLGTATTIERIRVEWPAVVSSPGEIPNVLETVIEPPDPRLRPSSAQETLVVTHPSL